jgi:hypothetical protein
MNGPIWRGGKFTTAITSDPTRSSGEWFTVICAEERLMPISGPKSTVSLNAGLRACGNGSTATIRPTRMSTFRKSSNVIGAVVGLT